MFFLKSQGMTLLQKFYGNLQLEVLEISFGCQNWPVHWICSFCTSFIYIYSHVGYLKYQVKCKIHGGFRIYESVKPVFFHLAAWEIMHLSMDKYIVNPILSNFSNLKEIMMKVLDTSNIKIYGSLKISVAQLAKFTLKK